MTDKVLEIDNLEVVSGDSNEVTATGSAIPTCNQLQDTTVEATKKEYSIVGDGLYASVSADEAPKWLTSIIDSVVNSNINDSVASLDEAVNNIIAALDEIEIAKNQYQELVNIESTIEGVIASRLATLNATVGTNSASILDLDATKVTEDEAIAIAANRIASELLDGAIRSEINRIDTTIATVNSSFAVSTANLESNFTDLQLGLEGNASATNSLYTYVGVDYDGNSTSTGLVGDIEILQKQNDGVIETIADTYDVMLNEQDGNPDTTQLVTTAEPYATWKAADDSAGNDDVRLAHVGDVYIKYQTTASGGKEYLASYKFVKTIPDGTSPFATDTEGYTWTLIVDQAAQLAYTEALNAYDLADGKRRVFVATNQPNPPYDVGDLWLINEGSPVVGTTVNGTEVQSGDLLRAIETKTASGTYEANDWVFASGYNAAIKANYDEFYDFAVDPSGEYNTFVNNISNQVDKKAESFYEESAPHPEGDSSSYSVWVGDLWKKPSTNQEYVYQLVNGNYVWVETDVPDVVYDTIDGKKAIYTGNNLPTGTPEVPIQENDMWITGDDPVGSYESESIYIWNGSSWIKPTKYTDDSAVVTLQNGLGNGTVAIDLSAATIDGTTPLDQFVANQIDDQVVVYSGNNHASQTGMKEDDIYIEKTTETSSSGQVVDVVNTYKYNGSSWVEIGNNSNLTNLADLADGKRTVYAGTTTPELQGYTPEERDIWIPEASVDSYEEGNVYIYTGSSWELATKTFVPIKVDDFESGLSNWTATANDTVVLETTDVYKGTNSALFTSNDTSAASSGFTGGTYTRVLNDGTITAGKKVLVEFYAKQPSSGASAEFGAAYSTNSVGNSGWNTFTPTTSWEKYSFTYNVSDTNVNEDYVGIWGDTSGLGGSVLIDDIKIKVESTANLDAFVDTLYKENLSSLQDQLDGKIDTYYQNNAPYANGTNDPNKDGDLWYDLNDKKLYVYRNDITTWTEIEDQTAIDAVSAAATAQATADGKITSYYIDTFSSLTTLSNGWTTQEKSDNTGDLGVVYADGDDENNTTWRWNGSSWVTTRDKKLVALASDVTNLSTELTNGTNTWANADSSLENTLSTAISDGDTVVESKFAYNSNLTLNGVTYNSGFGLATNLTDASIPIGESEFWVKADAFNVVDSFDNKIFSGDETGITINQGGAFKSNGYNLTSNSGVFMGWDGTNYQLMAGDGNQYMRWDGGNLNLKTKNLTISELTETGYLYGNGSDGFTTQMLVNDTVSEVGVAVSAEAMGIYGIASNENSNSSTVTGVRGVGRSDNTSTTFCTGGSFFSGGDGAETLKGVQATCNPIGSNLANNCYGGDFYASSGEVFNYGIKGASEAGFNFPNATSYGVLGLGQDYDFYSPNSSYGPFTGGHDCIVSDYLKYDVGDIAVDWKVYLTSNVSNSLFKVKKSVSKNEKPIGVFSSSRVRYSLETSACHGVNNKLEDSYGLTIINAVGEGQVNVCGEGGNLSNGDLIVTSSIPGKGMRQNKKDGTPDDVIRNITVAKVRGNWEFSSPDEVKMVPCIYLCG